MTPYQQFIAKSRYARYIPELQRREHWSETADRWIHYFQHKISDRVSVEHHIWKELRTSIVELRTLPSMRSIMTAGPALDKSNVAAYNCAYMPIDHPYCFDEAMYILMCGTGVGFSAESRYVDELPVINKLKRVDYTIVVEDSREGWCNAFRELLDHLWSGRIPKWNTFFVRPAGTPLKTFGGRASGPEPLEELFRFTVKIFEKAQRRALRPIEVHDIMCKVGEVVVVGGVRRSAMISLGDLSDSEHAKAKFGKWWEDHPERMLANNSAVYTEKPDMATFMAEWTGIYTSKSGERGIFNRQASQIQAAKNGKRSAAEEYGTNPCSEIILRPYQFCNLSTVVARAEDDLATLGHKVYVASVFGSMQATLTDFPYLRNIWIKNTREEALLGVSITGILGNDVLRGGGQALNHLKTIAVQTNEMWADILHIKPATAVTCVKPEGTVSQLTETKSGIHPGHAPFYIRRVRQDNKDPITKFLIEAGVPHEPCVSQPDTTTIFSFPQKSEGVNRNDITAIQHLELWLDYQRNWCEHKPSVTISVKEHEWMEVGAWVYKHFDECTGLSFLPYDGGSYRQAPYEDCTEEEYNIRVATMPHIDWDQFIETEDNVEGVQQLACVAGACSI